MNIPKFPVKSEGKFALSLNLGKNSLAAFKICIMFYGLTFILSATASELFSLKAQLPFEKKPTY
jgi:hypothetical protein